MSKHESLMWARQQLCSAFTGIGFCAIFSRLLDKKECRNLINISLFSTLCRLLCKRGPVSKAIPFLVWCFWNNYEEEFQLYWKNFLLFLCRKDLMVCSILLHKSCFLSTMSRFPTNVIIDDSSNAIMNHYNWDFLPSCTRKCANEYNEISLINLLI